MLRRDRAPDFLRQMVRDPFECAGLYFLPRFEEDDGISRLAIVFQNRYSRPCIPMIHLAPREVHWQLEPLEFAADGGECGVFRRTLNIPEDLRGREITFEIRGKNHYPDGHGRMLLFRDGLVIGRWSQAALNTITIAAAVTGHVHIAHSAKVSLRLPNESHTFDSIEHPDAIESIWLPGDDPVQTPRH